MESPAMDTADAQQRDQRGASVVEYALLVALIVLACIVALEAFGVGVFDSFTSSSTELESAGGSPVRSGARVLG